MRSSSRETGTKELWVLLIVMLMMTVVGVLVCIEMSNAVVYRQVDRRLADRV